MVEILVICKKASAIGRGKQLRQTGGAYLALLIAVFIISLVSATAIQLGAAHGQRNAEEQLLFVGGEFQRALQRYADATPAGLPRSPLSLEELLRDPRYPGVVRHLRQIYTDPFTDNADWGLIRDTSGRILAVHSRSKLEPLKMANFEFPIGPPDGRAKTYQEWIFFGPMINWARFNSNSTSIES